MNNVPDTIKFADTFARNQTPWFDGVFDWAWMVDAFAHDSKITPMDFDAVVERHGNFFVVETKESGTPIPKGQLLTLENLYRVGCFTVMLLWGKNEPEEYQLWCASGFRDETKSLTQKCTKEELTSILLDWRRYSENHWILNCS